MRALCGGLRCAKVRGQAAELPAPPHAPSETTLAPAGASTLPWPCHQDLSCFRPAHLVGRSEVQFLSDLAPPGHVHISWPNASVFVPSAKQSAVLLFFGCAQPCGAVWLYAPRFPPAALSFFRARLLPALIFVHAGLSPTSARVPGSRLWPGCHQKHATATKETPCAGKSRQNFGIT